MADDALSRNEVEDLLRSMDSGEKKKNPAAAPAKPGKSSATSSDMEAKADALLAGANAPPTAKSAAQRQRVVAYDFKRPERVGKEQMRAFQSLHEGFARNFGASLSALLRTIVEAKLISVDQLTYSEFVYSLEIPTCFNLLKPTPLEGNWILDISPALLYPIIDRMLGGAATPESALKRPLSEIEIRLTARITTAFLRDLTVAWANAVHLRVEVERIESNPQLVQIVPPNEVVILVSFELTMGKTRGMVNLCIPFNTIERIGSKLTNNSWIGYASSRSTDASQGQITNLIGESMTEVVVTLARSTLRATDLLNLQVGDIVSTEKDIREPLDVEVQGVVKFHAKAGALKGRKAIELLGVAESKKPLTSAGG